MKNTQENSDAQMWEDVEKWEAQNGVPIMELISFIACVVFFILWLAKEPNTFEKVWTAIQLHFPTLS
jgi:hypothetical protein